MKTSFALAGASYDMVSLENGRALFRAAPYVAGNITYTRTVEISHLESKNGSRRSMIKMTTMGVEDSASIPANGVTESCHLVLTHNPRMGSRSKECAQMAFNALGEFTFGVDATDFMNAFEVMQLALLSGTFVPDTYVDPSA